MAARIVRKKIGHLGVAAGFPLLKFCARLLPLRAIPCVGAALGDLARALLPRERRRVREHLALAFPEWSCGKRECCLRENFRHYGITLLELLNAPRLCGRVDFEGGVVPDSRPLILATGHIGNWELFGQALGARGFPLSAVARELYLSSLNAYLVASRGRAGFTTILRTAPDSGKLLLKAVRDGHILAMLIDQDTKVEAVFVPFFGHPAATPAGAARLALKKRLAVCVGTIARTRTGRHRVHFTPIDPSGLDEKELTALLTAELEKAIRAHPTQWVWVHRRWRTRPPSEPPVRPGDGGPSPVQGPDPRGTPPCP